MHHPRLSSFFAGAVLLLSLSACTPAKAPTTADVGTARVVSDTKDYLGGSVRTWTVAAPNGSHHQIGFTLPLAVVQNAPTSIPAGADPMMPNPAHSVNLAFARPASSPTVIDHLTINFNPVGHPPMPTYAPPHFDFHFYTIPVAEQMAIDCSDATPPPTDLLPPHHIVTKPGMPPGGECVPEMGNHMVDVLSPELSQDHPAVFTKTMILGSYGGKFTFVEPMITRDYLLKKENFTLPIVRPTHIDKSGLYPTMFTATYDPVKDAYDFVLSDFVPAS